MTKAAKIISYLSRRREHEHRRHALESFEATSMGDIAFLLLIFFIVTGSFIVRQGIFFSLPSKSSGVRNVAIESVMEIFPGANDYTVDEKKMTPDELKNEMRKRFAQNKELIVLFRMPQDIAYERLTDSLSIVREIGVQYVSVKDVEVPSAEAQ